MSEFGQGMQVVKVVKDRAKRKYHLDEKLLEHVLLNEEVRDLPAVVVSVAGAYRGGKSFLLNFFLRYLTSTQSDREDGCWLGEGSDPLAGFSWRGGIERNTTGILLWSEPIINTLPNGEKVAVILMDTQGTFDSESTVRDNSTIFALSTLLSSVQIYNISSNIQEDNLQHLELFTMYGQMVQEKELEGKAFQTLEFLIRDWSYPEDYAFGAEGGNLLLQDRLEITPDMPEELKVIRTHIRSSFEKLLCFLLPHPGLKVSRRTFKGSIDELEPDFRIYLQELVPSLFKPENLCPKIINGHTVTAGELSTYFKTYMNLFNSDKVLDPTTILKATVEAGILTCINAARDVYEKGMEADFGPKALGVPLGDVKTLHEKHMDAARTAFTSRKIMATQKEIDRYLKQLNTDLGNRLPQYEKSNLSKLQALIKKAYDVYDQTIRKVNKDQPLCLHPLDLDDLQRVTVEDALKVYDGGVKKISNKPDEKRAELVKIFVANFTKMKIINGQNNRDAVNAVARDVYEKGMVADCGSEQPIVPLEDLRILHEKYLDAARIAFNSKRNKTTLVEVDEYLIKLNSDLGNRLPQYEKSNLSKLEALMKKTSDAYDQTIRNVTKDQPLCLHPLDLDELQRVAVQTAQKVYDGGVKRISDKPDQKRAELTQTFAANFKTMKTTNEQNNINAVKDINLAYWKIIGNNMSRSPPLKDAEFIRSHDSALSQVLAMFQKKRNTNNSHTKDDHKTDLIETINVTYSNLRAINIRNIQIENTRKAQIDQNTKTLEQKIAKERHDRRVCLHKLDPNNYSDPDKCSLA